MKIKMVFEKAARLSFRIVVLVGTLSTISFVQADECCPPDNCTVEYVPYQSSVDCKDGNGLQNCCKNVRNFMDEWGIRLDSLWWQANADGIALGKEVLVERTGFNGDTGLFANVIRESRLKKPRLNYDAGIRFAISHQLPCCDYDLMFEWTHFYTTGHTTGKSIIDPAVQPNQYVAFIPYWETLAQNYPDGAKGRWKFDLNLYDLVVGKHFDITSCFSLRPYLGLRCAWIDQKYKVRSFVSGRNEAFNFDGASYAYTSVMHAKNDFIGAGPRLGCTANVDLYWGFSLIGNAAGSLVYGKFDRSSHEHFTNADHFFYKFNEFTNFDHDDRNDGCSRAITDLSIGLKWDHTCAFRSWRFPITIALSWEHHAFYDFNNFNQDANSFLSNDETTFNFGPDANLLPPSKKFGDIFTQGFTLSTHIGF
jgi:hypothetical protein